METLSALSYLCEGKTSVTGGSSDKRSVIWTFDDFFDVTLNKLIKKNRVGGDFFRTINVVMAGFRLFGFQYFLFVIVLKLWFLVLGIIRLFLFEDNDRAPNLCKIIFPFLIHPFLCVIWISTN